MHMKAQSKTKLALQYVADGRTPYAAAQLAGVTATTVYAALGRAAAAAAAGKVPCPCCGSVVPSDQINREVLK